MSEQLTNEQLWQIVLGELELLVGKPNFNAWLKKTAISSFENDHIIIAVPNTFTKSWLENKYHQEILRSLKNGTQDKVKNITYKVEKIKNVFKKSALLEELPPEAEIKCQPTLQESFNKYGLNSRYTFENFIVGGGNKIAYAACLSAIEELGQRYNPLFIYGGVGLGKTHLAHAVGHKVIEKNPERVVLYTTCEKFTNEYVQAIRNNQVDKFKNKFRDPDVLLVDDIQFLAGKEGSQEQFFHTFNDLHDANKQIVITCDRPPKTIPALEERLRSRFQWGMMADISQPDLETRIAILKSKCKEKNVPLNDVVINYVAAAIQDNIRELEGALNKIIVHCQFYDTKPTIDNVKNILSSLTQVSRKTSLTPKQLINEVAAFFDININDLLGQSREKRLAYPRQMAMFLMREELQGSYPAIGQEFGGRDHTTAMHACAKIKNEIENNEKARQEINNIKQRLYAA